MVKRSILAGLVLAATLGGCASRTPLVAYTSPGWYLERPRMVLVSGPEILGGPFSYDQCEAERLKWDTAPRMLCINEKFRGGGYGPFTGSSSLPKAPAEQPAAAPPPAS